MNLTHLLAKIAGRMTIRHSARTKSLRAGILMTAVAALLVLTGPGRAQTVFQDEFGGSALDGSKWDVYDGTHFIHRTQFGGWPWMAADSDGTRYARLKISTYNPDAAYRGTHLRGTEILTKTNFTLPSSGGLEIEARLRSRDVVRGLVPAFYTYGFRGVWPDTYYSDEIDYEICTNFARNQLWLNIWDDWNPSRGGPNQATRTSVTNLNWAVWNVYKIRWYRDRTEWLVNGVKVRTSTNIRPNDPMVIRLNIWAPNSSWGIAYDAALQPTSDSARNVSYHFDVDYVRVININSNGTPTQPPPPIPPPPPADTTPPTAAVNTPVHTYSYRSLSSATGTAGDTGGSGLKEVRGRLMRYSDGLYWSGSAWTTTAAETLASGTTSWTWTMPSLSDGKYAFRATARDNAGNIGYSRLVDFFIDTIPPQVSITTPVPYGIYSSISQATGTASDTVGVAQVRGRLRRYSDGLYWNGSAWVSALSEPVANGTTSWTFPFPMLANGKYSYQAIAQDWVGNTTWSAPHEFTVQTTQQQSVPLSSQRYSSTAPGSLPEHSSG